MRAAVREDESLLRRVRIAGLRQVSLRRTAAGLVPDQLALPEVAD